jgi:hypothetical protein
MRARFVQQAVRQRMVAVFEALEQGIDAVRARERRAPRQNRATPGSSIEKRQAHPRANKDCCTS